MKILAIETSCDMLSVALLEDRKLILELKADTPRSHSETLMLVIDKLFKKTKTSLSDIDIFACDNGPGSFTGIRIGLSTIQGFGFTRYIPCIAVSSLEALAYSCKENGYICSMIDAKHSNIYCGMFEKTRDVYAKVKKLKFCTINEFLEVLSKVRKKIFFVGNCGILYKDMIKSYLKCDFEILEDTIPTAKYIGMAAYDKYIDRRKSDFIRS